MTLRSYLIHDELGRMNSKLMHVVGW